MLLDPLVSLRVGGLQPCLKRFGRQMRTDLRAKPVVVTAQAQPARNLVPQGQAASTDQVMGLQLAAPATVSAASGLPDDLAPPPIRFFAQ